MKPCLDTRNMERQRVILISPGFTASEEDHNCLPYLQLYVRELAGSGLDVQVIALDYPFSRNAYTWRGISVQPCNGQNKRWRRPLTVWNAIRAGNRLIREASDTQVVIHSFWLGWTSVVGEWLARRHGLKHITTLMGQDVLPANSHWFKLLSNDWKKRLVVLSDFQNETLGKHFDFKAHHVIPWGVASTEIPSSLPDERPIDILGVGSQIGLKNWNLWLNTIKFALIKHPNIKAELIGDGPERSHLEAKVRELNLEQNVRIIGDLPRPQVLDKMRHAKLLLHTSNYESQAYVLSEAAMNGCQVVTTPVGIGPLMGFCAEDAAGLAKGIEMTLSSEGQAKPVTPFLLVDTAASYADLYNQPHKNK
ncbi:MAG: glycosyltransferase [Saprospiraceae bacterium]